VQEGLGRDPHAGELFCFRGRKGDLVKILWHDGGNYPPPEIVVQASIVFRIA
jgi:hypothetical protein